MGRKFFVGGNWKMNGTKDTIDKIVEFLNNGDLDPNCGETGQIDNGRISSQIQSKKLLSSFKE